MEAARAPLRRARPALPLLPPRQLAGFKAGALNYGLKVTDPRAEVVGVVDADYVVDPDWLAA